MPSRQFPNINCFQRQQESNVSQNPTFTSMLDNDFSSKPIMPGDLFKRLRENDKFEVFVLVKIFVKHNTAFSL